MNKNYGNAVAMSIGHVTNDKVSDSNMNTDKEDENVGNGQDTDRMTDAAALLVFFYLFFISMLSTCSMIIVFFVIAKYGFVVLIAVIAVIGGVAVVGATLASVITRDAKLTKARSKIKAWHFTVKDVILDEIQNFRDDLNAYSHGTLLLTYEGGNNDHYDEENSHIGRPTQFEESSETIDSKDAQPSHATNNTPSRHKPKSFIFRFAVAPFSKSSKKGKNNYSSNQSNKKKRSWMRNKKKGSIDMDLNADTQARNASYVPPVI